MADELSPAQYAVLRTYLEVANERFKVYKQTGAWPANSGYPPDATIIGEFVQVVPAVFFEPWLSAAELETQAEWYAANKDKPRGLQLAPKLRRGDIMFREPEQLRAALDTFAPQTAAVVKALPGSETGGIEWWAIALAAGGALYYIGRLNWKGALVSAIAARALLALGAYLGFTAKTAEGKTFLEQLYEDAKAAAARTADVVQSLGIAAAVIAVAVVGLALASSGTSSSTSARSTSSNPGEPGGPHPGTLPPKGAELLERVYEERKAAGASKASAARQAWAAVKGAGWVRYAAADGGEWWGREGQSDLLVRTLLQLEQRTGNPADELLDVWAERALRADPGLALEGFTREQLLAAMQTETKLNKRTMRALRAAAFELAGVEPLRTAAPTSEPPPWRQELNL